METGDAAYTLSLACVVGRSVGELLVPFARLYFYNGVDNAVLKIASKDFCKLDSHFLH